MKVFQLIVTAIVAITLIALFFTFISGLNTQENLNSQLNKAITKASFPNISLTILFINIKISTINSGERET